jgi:hypothetical protein
MRQSYLEQTTLRPLLAGGLMFALVGLLIDVRGIGAASKPVRQVCQGDTKAGVVVSREQLAQLLLVPERDSKTKVQQILNEPYCQLPNLEIRAGVAADRVAYPLAFDPRTWLVILYEGNEYAGYQFRFE